MFTSFCLILIMFGCLDSPWVEPPYQTTELAGWCCHRDAACHLRLPSVAQGTMKPNPYSPFVVVLRQRLILTYHHHHHHRPLSPKPKTQAARATGANSQSPVSASLVTYVAPTLTTNSPAAPRPRRVQSHLSLHRTQQWSTDACCDASWLIQHEARLDLQGLSLRE